MCVLVFEPPVCAASFCVASLDPSADVARQVFLTADAFFKALARQDGQFRFGHVEPRAVFGRVVPLELVGDASGLYWLEGCVE